MVDGHHVSVGKPATPQGQTRGDEPNDDGQTVVHVTIDGVPLERSAWPIP